MRYKGHTGGSVTSLLSDIQANAIDSSANITDLLRKCKVLAKRLGQEEMSHWVDQELGGYSEDEVLPDYRIVPAEARGNFYSSFRELKNGLIPSQCLPEKYRYLATTVYLRGPISSIAHLAKASATDTPVVNWPADVVAVFSTGIYQDMACLNAWQVISPATIVGILDTVRNRVLSFALEIETIAPNAGEVAEVSPATKKAVSQVFETIVHGNVGNITSGSHDFEQHNVMVVGKNDLASLRKTLADAGVAPTDIDDLEEALKDDAGDGDNKGIGKRAAMWIGSMIRKASEGVGKVALDVAPVLLAKVISQYLGLPQ